MTIPQRPSKPMTGETANLQEEHNSWQVQTLADIKVECTRNLEEARSTCGELDTLSDDAMSPILQDSLGISSRGASPPGSKKGSKDVLGALPAPSRTGSKESCLSNKDRMGSKGRQGSKDRMGSKGSIRRDSKVSVNEHPDVITPSSPEAPDSPAPEKIVRRGKLNVPGGNWRRTMTRTISIQSTEIVDTPEFMWQKYLKHFTSTQLDALSALFDSYDEDLSGNITIEDSIYVATSWIKSTYRCENPEPTEEIVQAALAECSKVELEYLTFEHVVLFVKHIEKLILASDEWAGFNEDDVLEFKSVFKDFCKSKGIGDGDATAALSTLDTFMILEELGRDTGDKDSQERVIAIIKEVDINKSGDLDFLEFLHLLRRVQSQDASAGRQRERELIQQSGFADEEVEKFHQLFDLYQGTDGTFTVESLREMFTKIEIQMTAERRKYLAGMVHKISDNSLLTLGEFLVLLRDLLDQDFADMRSAANESGERAAYNPMSSNNSAWDEDQARLNKKLTPGEWIEKNRAKLQLGKGRNWVTRMILKKSAIKNRGLR
eukprot:gnl/MRDRNA2_/MRDRNA2_127592_c0_seq1.p1 gnl/MRDRNA2_/MRDRNA2_127592_c0~~gnl/MRDRNA2_/MRDRNA2_127592_c0_seq1.p1  ORF type:complete len:548 (-),score=115.91 gnl/MRDRNA2_/MRDRNA2_127592_c0_seq1:276-1919(-)